MNSPLTTTVVGTSTAAVRPNPPLTPAMRTTIARPKIRPRILRRLLRHMPLHRHSRLETGGDNHFVIVFRAERHRARPDGASVQYPHRKPVLLAHNDVARYDDGVVFPFELHVDRR